MAFAYNVFTHIENTTHDVARCPIVRDASPLVGVITGPGVIPASSPAATIDYWAQVTGNLLVTSNGNTQVNYSAGTNSLPTLFLIRTWTTAAGVMEGVSMTAASATVRCRSKYTWSFPRPLFAQIRVRYYHVASGGGETLLGNYTFNVSTSWANYSGSLGPITTSWGAGEKFRVKHYGYVA